MRRALERRRSSVDKNDSVADRLHEQPRAAAQVLGDGRSRRTGALNVAHQAAFNREQGSSPRRFGRRRQTTTPWPVLRWASIHVSSLPPLAEAVDGSTLRHGARPLGVARRAALDEHRGSARARGGASARRRAARLAAGDRVGRSTSGSRARAALSVRCRSLQLARSASALLRALLWRGSRQSTTRSCVFIGRELTDARDRLAARFLWRWLPEWLLELKERAGPRITRAHLLLALEQAEARVRGHAARPPRPPRRPRDRARCSKKYFAGADRAWASRPLTQVDARRDRRHRPADLRRSRTPSSSRAGASTTLVAGCR